MSKTAKGRGDGAYTHLRALLEERIDVGGIVQNPPVCDNGESPVSDHYPRARSNRTHSCTYLHPSDWSCALENAGRTSTAPAWAHSRSSASAYR